MRDDLKERIRDSVDIVDVIGERIPLRKAGKNFVARCPFHAEKTPSFNVNPERQIYRCFGCGVGGDVFRFVMDYDRVSFPEALRSLAKKAGIAIEEGPRDAAAKAASQKNDVLYELNAMAAATFSQNLTGEAGTAALRYLRGRGLKDETIKSFGLGFAQDSWDALARLVVSKGHSLEQGAEAGLLVRSEKGRIYDRFRNRITFPISNVSGRVVAFGARTMDKDEQAKYLNSSDSPVYHKGRELYGLFNARDAIRHEGHVLVVEGYMDVLQLAQNGIANVIATCGTALTKEHGVLLRRFAEKIVLLFDGDEAGLRAAVRGGDVLLAADVEPTVVLLPAGDDPDTFVATEGPDALRRMVEAGEPYLQFKWRHLLEEHDGRTATGKNKAISEMLDGIAGVEDEIVRNLMAGQVAEWSAVDEQLILRAVTRRRQGPRRTRESDEPAAPERWRPPKPEKELLALMLDHSWVCGVVKDLDPECFTDATAREMADAIIAQHAADGSVTLQDLLDLKPEDAWWAAAVSSLDEHAFRDEEANTAALELVASLQLSHLKRKIDSLRSELRTALTNEERIDLLRQQQELQRVYEQVRAAVVRQSGD